MGGGQSQERVLGVEERPGDDEPQIIVTEDFLRHLHDKQQDPESGDSNQEPHDQEKQDLEEDDVQFMQSAEQLLVGDQYSQDTSGDRSHDDSVWKRKFEFERQKNQNLKSMNGETFEKAVDEVREKFASKTTGDMMPVCEGCRDKVDDCYHRNNAKPLLCSSLVNEYIACVEKHRKGLLQAPSRV